MDSKKKGHPEREKGVLNTIEMMNCLADKMTNDADKHYPRLNLNGC
jgi:hypothetical protein